MAIPDFRRNKLQLIGVAVALPALVLASVGIALTMYIAAEIETESARYNTYLAEQVTEAFEQELLARLREAIPPAEEVARAGGTPEQIRRALASRAREFEAAHFVPVDELNGYSLLVVDQQLLVFGADPSGRRQHPFAALMLNGPDGVVGAGGWWFNPRAFLAAHLKEVAQDRLTSNPRMYGGIESVRNLSIQVLDARGNEIGRVRDPGGTNTGRAAEMTGPFEGFRVLITPTDRAAVAWAGRFVWIEIAFIVLMSSVLLAATFFGLRYATRQIELAQIKTSFLSNVTHELKTPIAVIRLAAETLEMKRFSQPEDEDKLLRTVMRETERLSQLVTNILDFSRLESGQRAFQFAPVDLAEVVESTMESFGLRLEDAGFHYEVAVPNDLPPARADAQAISHCLINLLDNAMKYSRQRKEVKITAAARGQFVSLSVADRGIGIEPSQQQRIFEKFVRVETGLVHDVKGTGLGLSLVDQIIRAHHGRVEVVSTPGEGSIFTLILPVWSAGRDAPRPSPQAPTGG